MEGLIREHLVFHGRVQGVGFRFRACMAARRIRATGWVENRPDGSVSMEIQGTREQIDRVLELIRRGTFVRIDAVEAESRPVQENERGFTERDG